MLRRLLIAQLLLVAAPAAAQQETFPGIVIDYSAAETGKYIGSPAIAVLPDGRYVASHDLFGPASGELEAGITRVFISRDRGASWGHQADLTGQFWSSLFVHGGKLYVMGTSRQVGSIMIRRSGDGGVTWTSPKDSDTGILAEGNRYHTAPVPVVVHDQRLWRSMEVAEGSRPDWASVLMSAPVGADLLKAASWTMSSTLQNKQAGNPALAWIEGNVVLTPGRKLVNILRLNGVDQERAAMVRVSPDGKELSWDAARDVVDFVGGGTKFTIRYDPKSRRYWSLVNKQKNPDTYRNVLVLTSSPDLTDWRVESTIFNQLSRADRAFQYVDWLFDGEDIIAVSRTAWDGAHRPHDANYMTFHRIRNFRSRTPKDAPLM